MPQLLSLCATTRETTMMRSPCTAMKTQCSQKKKAQMLFVLCVYGKCLIYTCRIKKYLQLKSYILFGRNFEDFKPGRRHISLSNLALFYVKESGKVGCRGPAPADPGYSKERRRRRGSGNNCLITL